MLSSLLVLSWHDISLIVIVLVYLMKENKRQPTCRPQKLAENGRHIYGVFSMFCLFVHRLCKSIVIKMVLLSSLVMKWLMQRWKHFYLDLPWIVYMIIKAWDLQAWQQKSLQNYISFMYIYGLNGSLRWLHEHQCLFSYLVILFCRYYLFI